MDGCPDEPDLINLYALVTYLPNPLGSFLNGLRQELVPGCHLRAHVTVLPPRQIQSSEAAWHQLQRQTPDFSPIELELGEIEVFEKTNVIYLAIRRGHDRLKDLHSYLAHSALEFQEPHEYHPHITLAQGLPEEKVKRSAEYAQHRWNEFRGSRRFLLENMTFVQSTASSDWVDLGELSLGVVKPVS